MTLTKAMIDALVENGCTLEMLAALVKADIDEQEAQRARRRKGDAQRQRESRENRRKGQSQPVTTCHSDPPIEYHTPSAPDISPNGESQAVGDERAFLEIWAATAKPLGLPCPKSLSPKLRRSYRARLRDTGLSEIQRAIERIPKSSFLRGQSGNWNGANLTFLFRPDSVRRINEGEFDDRAKPQSTSNTNRGGSTASAAQLAMQRLGYT